MDSAVEDATGDTLTKAQQDYREQNEFVAETCRVPDEAPVVVLGNIYRLYRLKGDRYHKRLFALMGKLAAGVESDPEKSCRTIRDLWQKMS